MFQSCEHLAKIRGAYFQFRKQLVKVCGVCSGHASIWPRYVVRISSFVSSWPRYVVCVPSSEHSAKIRGVYFH